MYATMYVTMAANKPGKQEGRRSTLVKLAGDGQRCQQGRRGAWVLQERGSDASAWQHPQRGGELLSRGGRALTHGFRKLLQRLCCLLLHPQRQYLCMIGCISTSCSNAWSTTWPRSPSRRCCRACKPLCATRSTSSCAADISSCTHTATQDDRVS